MLDYINAEVRCLAFAHRQQCHNNEEIDNDNRDSKQRNIFLHLHSDTY